MVDDYVLQRAHEEQQQDDGGFRDEDSARRMITFRVWLKHYPWPPREVVDEWTRVA